MSAQIGEAFVKAIASRDAAGLLALLQPDVDFRAMTPSKFWESSSAAEVVNDVILGRWFEETDHIDAVDSIEDGAVVDRNRVRYRFAITSPGGSYLVEQQAYYDVADDDRISWLRIMCSGYMEAG